MATINRPGDLAIGIDLGTTNSCVAVYRNGKVEVIANDQGSRTTPSWVYIKDNEVVVGEAAKQQCKKNPANSVYGVKRLIGKWYDDTLLERLKTWPFEVFNAEGKPKIKVNISGHERTYFPEQISTMVLKKMKSIAEAFLERSVSKAVVAVPAHFNDNQRERTQEACRLAGLEIIAVINEPTAAAVAYAFQKEKTSEKSSRTVLVYDVGGGTLDVSILSVTDNTYEVMATAGDDRLAGEDFDENLFQYLRNIFKREHNIEIESTTTAGAKAVAKLRKECEEAKRHLSHDLEVEIEIESLYQGKDLNCTLSRTQFEKINEKEFRKTLDYVKKALTDSGLEASQIDDVVLVGGSTRIPKLQNLLYEVFNERKVTKGVNPDEAVAYGAAVRAAFLTDNFKDVNFLLLEVTPHSLGVETCSGIMEVMIKRNTRLPASCETNFTTVYANQESILFEIYQGERSIAKDNVAVGNIKISGIRPAPPGVPTIVVKFELNKDGRLVIKAHEKKYPENAKTVTITRHQVNKHKPSLEKNLTESQKNQVNDAQERERVLAMNKLQTECFKMKYFFESTEMALALESKDRSSTLSLIQNSIFWMNTSKQATKAEYEDHLRKIEAGCKDLLAKHRPVFNKMFEQE